MNIITITIIITTVIIISLIHLTAVREPRTAKPMRVAVNFLLVKNKPKITVSTTLIEKHAVNRQYHEYA